MNFEEIFLNVPKPHIPEKLPIELSKSLYDCEIIKLISKANNAMGAYRGFFDQYYKSDAFDISLGFAGSGSFIKT